MCLFGCRLVCCWIERRRVEGTSLACRGNLCRFWRRGRCLCSCRWWISDVPNRWLSSSNGRAFSSCLGRDTLAAFQMRLFLRSNHPSLKLGRGRCLCQEVLWLLVGCCPSIGGWSWRSSWHCRWCHLHQQLARKGWALQWIVVTLHKWYLILYSPSSRMEMTWSGFKIR